MMNVLSAVLTFFWCMTFGLQGISMAVGAEFKTLPIGHQPGPMGQTELNLLKTVNGTTSFLPDQPALFHSQTLSIPLTQKSDFQTFTPIVSLQDFTGSNFELQIRGSSDGTEWNPWVSVVVAKQAPFRDSVLYGEMLVWDSNIQFFEYKLIFPAMAVGTPAPVVQEVRLDFFSPGSINKLFPEDVVRVSLPGADPDCPCTLPTFADRSQWDCPDGRQASCTLPAFAPTSHLILHEIALPASIDHYSAFVRAVWQVQTQSYGQCDLTYNWLIDPNGVIYEGRGGGDDVQGAHLCANNTGTMGIGLIGSEAQQSPTPAAMMALSKLLTWKSCDSGLDPADTAAVHGSSNRSLPVISLPATLCDAQHTSVALSSTLPFLRQQVRQMLDSCLLGVSINPEKELTLTAGPNPASGRLFIRGEALQLDAHQIQLIDLQGQVLITRALQPRISHELTLEGLSPGLYLVRVLSADQQQRWQQKILVY